MPSATDWITLTEAQAILAAANVHFTTSTIAGWARAGRLQSIKLGGRRYVRRGEVRALIAGPAPGPGRGRPAGPVRGRAGLTRAMDPAAILERILERPLVALVMRVLDVYGRAAGGLLANGLAFAALFAAFPLVLLILGIAGLVVVDPDAQERLADALKALVPPLADFVDQGMAALSTNATAASILGFIGVVWAVSQLYVTLDVAFSRIFADAPGAGRLAPDPARLPVGR